MLPLSQDRTTRLRAAMLLGAFVLALLLGVFGHPASDDASHVCDGSVPHLEDAPDHAHDAQACAGCHLFHTLSQSDAPATAGAPLSAPSFQFTADPQPARWVEREAAHAFDPRGPPA